jgi:orotate phosphoribosyltransferase
MRELMTTMASLLLWELEAIKVSRESPFRLTSGNYSPIYINCRRVISNAAAIDLVTACFHRIIEEEGIEFTMIAGGETAGIPFASFLAHRLAKPMLYVRKASKGHGTDGLVEGVVKAGSKILLVEDLITDGNSKINFIKPLRREGATVQECLVLFDRLQGGAKILEQDGVRLISITDIDKALGFAETRGLIPRDPIAQVREYLKSPKLWHESRGLPYSTTESF